MYKWDIGEVQDILFLPGRQGSSPPAYKKIGSYEHFYDRQSVMSVLLAHGETVKIGDTLAFRLAPGYYEESIESIHVEHRPFQNRVGRAKWASKRASENLTFMLDRRCMSEHINDRRPTWIWMTLPGDVSGTPL